LNKAILVALSTVILSTNSLGEIYKYKDAKGNWVFSDKKPIESPETNIEEIQLKKRKAPYVLPELTSVREDNIYSYRIKNTFFAPIEIALVDNSGTTQTIKRVLAPNTDDIITQNTGRKIDYSFYWTVGNPDIHPNQLDQRYLFPAGHKGNYRITQAFNGRFSHNKKPSLNAVDIGMDLGTNLVAARDGIVAWVKDDYHLGGANRFFLDKANVIYILHEDGTYAIYAHILKGSALVKAGDQVKAGDRIARSGDSGYSTGPHLHFAIWHNTGYKTESIPFRFYTTTSRDFVPQYRQIITVDN